MGGVAGVVVVADKSLAVHKRGRIRKVRCTDNR